MTVLLDQANPPHINKAVAANHFICAAVWENVTVGYFHVKIKYFCVANENFKQQIILR